MLRAVSPCHNVGRICAAVGRGGRGGVMRRSTMWHVLMARHVLMAAAGLAGAVVTSPAMAQVPVPVGPDCVCLRIAVDALGADLAAKRQAYDGMQAEIGQIDNQLAGRTVAAWTSTARPPSRVSASCSNAATRCSSNRRAGFRRAERCDRPLRRARAGLQRALRRPADGSGRPGASSSRRSVPAALLKARLVPRLAG